MKNYFSKVFESIAKKDKNIFFLTGDLGFNAFENIKLKMSDRFINAGVAEQNMVSVSAGLAKMGFKPWVYSIAPFLILKATEQIRNDICHQDLNVKLIGNGGGYGYGVMGETHHALEDIAIMSSLSKMKVYIPAFLEDIGEVVYKMWRESVPGYLRLNLAPKTEITLPKYSPVRHFNKGKKVTMIVLGPLIHQALNVVKKVQKDQVDLWCVSELPVEFPQKLLVSIHLNKNIIIIEEHTHLGGLGGQLLSHIARKKIKLNKLIHLYAKGYPSNLYGSHFFHLKENELDENGILKNLNDLIYG